MTVTETELELAGCSAEGDWCAKEEDNYYDLPGGVPIDVVNAYPGSICPAFYQTSLGRGWTTAGHVADSNNNAVYYPSYAAGSQIGYTKKATFNGWDEDYAFIENDGSKSAVPKITDGDNSGGYYYDVKGIVTDTEIESDAFDVGYRTVGRSSCATSGYVRGVSGTGVKFNQDVESGDSGGVLVKPDGGCCYVAGNITVESNWGTDDEDGDNCPDKGGGVTAESLESFLNGTWTTTNC